MVCAGSNCWRPDRPPRSSEGIPGAIAFRRESVGRSAGCDWIKTWNLKLKSESHRIWTVTLAAWFGVAALVACGPDFPNTLLDGGDRAVLMAPVADFFRELQRIKPAALAFLAAPATNGFYAQSTEADLSDLNIALRKTEAQAREREEILKQHRAQREKLQRHQSAL